MHLGEGRGIVYFRSCTKYTGHYGNVTQNEGHVYAKAPRIREVEEGQCQSEGAGEGGGQVQKGTGRLQDAGGQIHGHTKRLRDKNDSGLQGTY